LDSACGGDSALHAEVDSLLVADERACDFMESPAVGSTAPALGKLASRGAVAVGERIGAYRIVRTIASGGMGTVYEAVQDHPKRAVALKVIRPGIASPSALRRFQHEAELLGRLSHPGIAHIYEAGTHAGPDEAHTLPFFAMEYIERADTITNYADATQLATRARLELFLKVCDAVHYGHQRGVIHRDLKPANILVDPSGEPKIIDFGVARLTQSDIQLTTVRTNVGQLIGTLSYMSPEQVAGDPQALDTRSDVYALGVIAFELLTGHLPYDLTGKPIPEAVRLIQEQDPRRPSAIRRTLRGDLETIVLRALEKDPARRYPSASDLAADVRRFLSDEPIAARPPSTFYQFRKFARRNRAAVAGVVVAFVGLLSGTVFATWQAYQATAESRRAREAERNATRQTEAARVEAHKAQRVSEFLQDMLAAADPEQARGRQVTVLEVLDHAAQRIEMELPDEPIVAAALRYTIGLTYHGLGAYEQAEAHLRATVGVRKEVLGDSHPDTLAAMSAWAAVSQRLGKAAEAESTAHAALELARRSLGDEDAITLSAMNILALVLQDRNALAEAEPLRRRLLEAQRRKAGDEHPATLLAMNNLAWLLMSQGRDEEAAEWLSKTLAIRRRLSGDDHPETLRTMINLANTLRELGRAGEALPLATDAVAGCLRILGERHGMTHYALDRLVWVHIDLGQLEDAEALARKTLQLRRQTMGTEHPYTLYSMHTLAVVLSTRGMFAEAEQVHRETMEARRRVLGPEHPDTLASMNGLAVALGQQRRYDGAATILRQVLDIRRRVSGAEHPETLGVLQNLALVLESGGRLADAEQTYREVCEIQSRALGATHPDTLNSTHGLARTLLGQGAAAQAEPLLREIVAVAEGIHPAGHWLTATYRIDLGRCLTALERYFEAETLLLRGYEDVSAAPDERGELPPKAVRAIVELYEAWGKPGHAAEYRALSPVITETANDHEGR
jgi:tetratricopeptide (TPR) repeat protein